MFAKRFGAVAVTAALLATTAACGGSDSGDAAGTDRSLDVVTFASLNGVPTFAAEEKGLFTDADLDVTIKTAKTSSEMVPQLLGGKVDLALVDVATSLVAASQGIEIVYVAAATAGDIPAGQEEYSFANLWTAKDSGITSAAELTGKTIGIPQIKSQPWVDIRNTIDEAGGDSSKVKFLESPDPLAALKSGQVDAATTPEPVGTVERAKGELDLLGPVAAGEGSVSYVWIATRAWAEKNTKVLGEFTDVIAEANGLVIEDAELAVAVAAEVLGAPADLLAKAPFPNYSTSPLSIEQVQQAIDYMGKYDMFEKGAPDAAKVLFQP